MKLSFNSPNFKGYDAAPLKAIHVEESTCAAIKDELEEIAQQENFELRQGLDYYRWTQDLKTIVEKDGKPFLIVNDRVEDTYLEEMKLKYGISGKKNELIATGGNTFIGKFPNGEKWMMLGYDELATKSYKYLSQEYGIKEENIIPIPQQNYHLDMFMRPIGYPFVLIDNPELSKQKLSSLGLLGAGYDYILLNKNFKDFESARSADFASHKSAVAALEKAGFIPIEIAGVFGSGVNFMNAIINKHPNGTISYITNASECETEFVSKLQGEFEKELRQKVPNIDKVHFVKGKDDRVGFMHNHLTYALDVKGGGIHCMTMEEPDFEAWV